MKTIITLSGMSCSGKTVLAEYASNNVKDDFIKIITSTTRPARAAEINGQDYHFLTKPEFLSKVEQGRFLEHEMFGENLYGTSMDELEKAFASGKLPFAVVEPNGARTIRVKGEERGISVLNVFIDCPLEVSLERWYERYLLNVSQNDPQTEFFAKRIATSIAIEPAWRDACDYQLVLPFGSTEHDSKNQLKTIKEYAERGATESRKVASSRQATAIDISKVKASIISLLESEPEKSKFIRLAIKIAKNGRENEKHMSLS